MSETATSCVRPGSPRLAQTADLAVSHAVVDEVKKFAGRGHPGHVGAPALFDPGVELGHRGVALARAASMAAQRTSWVPNPAW